MKNEPPTTIPKIIEGLIYGVDWGQDEDTAVRTLYNKMPDGELKFVKQQKWDKLKGEWYD